jgi:acyl carrier protein
LILAGVWFYERRPRWRAAKEHARREPLSDVQFGERFFPPDQAGIAARLRRIAANQLGRDLTRLHPEDSLTQMLTDGFDSLDSVEMLMAVEEEFGIELDNATAEKIRTLRDLVNAVASQQPFLVKWRREMGRATEEQFSVSLSRETLAAVATPIEFADAIAARLGDQVKAMRSCQSQRAFHLLRSAMMRTLKVPRGFITPATPLHALVRWRTAHLVWMQLRDAVAARQWPPLVRPGWMSWLVHGLPLLLGAAIAFGLPWLNNRAFLQKSDLVFWMNLAAELWVWIAIPMVIGSWILLGRVSLRFRWGFPRNIRTVGDLIPYVATSAEATWSREEIERRVQSIVVNQLRVPAEHFQADAQFGEALELAVGVEKPQPRS